MTVSLIVPDIAGLHRVHWWGATGGRNNTCAMMGWVKCYQLWGWCWSTHYTALCEENKRPTLWQAAGALATCTKVWCFCALLQHVGFYRLTCALWKTSREILLSAWNLTVVSKKIRGTSFAVKNIITLSQMEMVFFAHCLLFPPRKTWNYFGLITELIFFSFKKSSHWQKWWHVPLGINSTVEQSKIFPHFWLNSLGCYFQCTANILKKSF